jgi:putative endonuclease
MYHVDIMASERRTLYTGVTGRLIARVWQHRTGATPGFSSRYRTDKLVHFEEFRDASTAIA